MDINSNKIIIIKTIVGFMIKKQQNAIQKLLFIFSTKTYGLGTQKNHLNGKVHLSTQKQMLKLMSKKFSTVLSPTFLAHLSQRLMGELIVYQ